ncbi:417_t:CDS:1, partial [Scutellospora calospora]
MIAQGIREEKIPGTPEDYANLFEKCWSAERDQRPELDEILKCLD